MTSTPSTPKLNRHILLQAAIGIMLCVCGFYLTRREPYVVQTVLASAGGCNMPTDIYEARTGTPSGSVLLFHGLSANKKVMSLVAQEFTNQELRVFVPDLPGHGKSPGPFSPARVEFCAEALVRDLATRHAIISERTLLVGHSMGGAIATRVAANSPVAGVIAISPAPMHPANSLAPEMLLFPTPPILAAHSLILSAAWEPESIRNVAQDLVTKSTNKPVQYETVPRTSHVSILFSQATFDFIRTWTTQILGTSPESKMPKNLPVLGCILGLLGMCVIAPPFLREITAPAKVILAPTNTPQSPATFLRSALLLAIAAALSALAAQFVVPFRFLRLFQMDYIASFLFFVGFAMLVIFRERLPSAKSFLTPGTGMAAAAAIVLVLLFGGWLELTFYEAWLTASRWLRFPLLLLVLLPWHLTEELLLGSPHSSNAILRLARFAFYRLILWLTLVAAMFYLHSGRYVFLLLATNIFLFSILQRLATDVVRDQTRSVAAATIFGAILFAAFALAILPIA